MRAKEKQITAETKRKIKEPRLTDKSYTRSNFPPPFNPPDKGFSGGAGRGKYRTDC